MKIYRFEVTLEYNFKPVIYFIYHLNFFFVWGEVRSVSHL